LIHWLARPHLLSILLTILWCAAVEDYRRRRSRWILLLPLLLAPWANLHGAFLATFPMLLIYACGEAAEFAIRGRWQSRERRGVLGTYALVAALSAGATLATPYGIHLYAHLSQYLSDDRLLASILEFQSPNFHEIEGKTLEVLLLLAIVAAVNALRERRCVEAGLVLFWAHMTLQSKRHVALAAVVLIPIVAEQWSKLAREASDRLASDGGPWCVRWRALRERYRAFLAIDRQLPGLVAYPLALTLLLVAAKGPWMDPWIPGQFDARKYPVAASDFIAAELPKGHVYAHDQYGSYLIYRFYPRLKVFVDGRSDFYRQGPVLADMLKLTLVAPSWQKILDGYDVQWMVLRRDEPLALIAEMSGRWANLYRDETAQVMVRKDGPNAETVASR
jgi:hypothetical protein